MKKYMDIENLREFDIDLGGGMVRAKNCQGFSIGDHVVVSEKIDGSNFSIRYNESTGKFDAFSRNKQLDEMNTLNGAWNYSQSLSFPFFPDNIIVFGEWTGARNKISYDEDKREIWYVFDVWDVDAEEYWLWESVKELCDLYGFCYANVLYDGEFVGWDHIRSLCNKPSYGKIQEGVVVKNQSRLSDSSSHTPYYLKIVNEEFKESKIKRTKPDAEEKEKQKSEAEELATQIVTDNRVQKILLKLRDEQILPSIITPQDMSIVAKNLPKRVYEDCLKEEPEVVKAMGEFAGKTIARKSIEIARALIL